MGKYVIKKVLANNFKGIPLKEINEAEDLILFDFSKNGLVIFSGPNGYGKTTVFDIVEILLSKDITRLNSTKSGSKRFRENGLLNDNSAKGYIGLVLENQDKRDDFFTIIGEICNDGTVKDISESIQNIKIYKKDGNLDKTIAIIGNEVDLRAFEKVEENVFIDISKDVFNLFYYISQEESTHFLKQKETDKVNTLDKLVNIESVIKFNLFLKSMINNQGGQRKSCIDNLISVTKRTIQMKIIDSRSKNVVSKDCEYSCFSDSNLVLESIPDWDKKDIEENDIETLEFYVAEIDNLMELLSNKEEYLNHFNKNRIEFFLKNKKNIENFLELLKLNLIVIGDKNFDKNKLKEFLTKYTEQKSFKVFLERFKHIDLENKLTYEETLACFDILGFEPIFTKDEFIETVEIIKNKEKDRAENQKALNNLQEIRAEFILSFQNFFDEKFHEEYGLDDNICPMCGTMFDEGRISLISKISETTESMKKLTDKTSQELNGLRNDFRVKLESLKKQVEERIDELSTISDRQFNVLNGIANVPKSQENLYEFIEFLAGMDGYNLYLKEYGLFKEFSDDLLDTIKDTSNEFAVMKSKINFDNTFDKYFKKDWESYNKLAADLENTKIKLNDKKEFVQSVKNNKILIQKQSLDVEIRDLVKRLLDLENLKGKLSDLDKIYSDEISRFRNDLITDIEIPLYLYTGKILQNYQRGLGVFIKNNLSSKNIKFVPSYDSEHEIIHSFSSGQLSGFVIAFMLVMNKVYTSRKNEFNTILIDDPVQTMDDINIASLVEVLRNEFSDKQLLLSTHEDNKAGYIMYKFNKYGIDSEYFDVKETIYGNLNV